MDRQVKWTEPAVDDVERIGAYIMLGSPFYARTLVEQLYKESGK